jgi:hypothetical protein
MLAYADTCHPIDTSSMEQSYLEAWDEWADSDGAKLWEHTAADGITDAPR